MGRQMGPGTATPAAVRRQGRSGAGFTTHSARTSPTPPRPSAQGTGWIMPAAAPSPAPDLGCDQNVPADTDKQGGRA
jgi:hypothetical protein